VQTDPTPDLTQDIIALEGDLAMEREKNAILCDEI
jgi:hypothetical protein